MRVVQEVKMQFFRPYSELFLQILKSIECCKKVGSSLMFYRFYNKCWGQVMSLALRL